MPTILTKRSNTPGAVPATADLTNASGGAELAVNTADKRLFTINSSSAVVELGTNPGSLTCADASFTLVKAASASITNLTATSLVLSNLSIASANVTTLTSASATITNLLGTTLTISGNTFLSTSTGNVGIGTSSPAYKLDVLGSSYVVGRFLRNGTTTASGGVQVGNNSKAYTIYADSTGLTVEDTTAAADRLKLSADGNLGLGVTPSAWEAGGALQLGTTASNSYSYSKRGLTNNAYFDGSNWRYYASSSASLYQPVGAVHAWYNAASGTAGNTITFTQALTLNANGALVLQGGDTGANGVGVTFPATQSASSNANTLDDYEEGTWTPSLGGNTTYTARNGRYTKIGRTVYFQCDLNITSIGTGSQTTISDLPFTNAFNSASGVHAVYYENTGTSITTLIGYITTTSIVLVSSTAAANSVGPNNIFQNGTLVTLQGFYFV